MAEIWVGEIVGHTVHLPVRICVDDGEWTVRETVVDEEGSGGATGVRAGVAERGLCCAV